MADPIEVYPEQYQSIANQLQLQSTIQNKQTQNEKQNYNCGNTKIIIKITRGNFLDYC